MEVKGITYSMGFCITCFDFCQIMLWIGVLSKEIKLRLGNICVTE